MIDRQLHHRLAKKCFQGKAILLIGSRQVGKTTLVKEVVKQLDTSVLFLDGDDPAVRSLLKSPSTEEIRQIIGQYKVVFIDEAQRIASIGLTDKIITDQFKKTQLILSGSSSFDLGQEVQEPLTGRKWTYELFPISWQEWQDHIGYVKSEQDLLNRLVLGLYPDVLNHQEDATEVLKELTESYLYKDVLQLAGLRKPQLLQKLLQALAYQVGSEVVYKEIADLLRVDPKTIAHYIEIMEKAFIIFRLPSFSRNLRNEIKSNQKIYFYDNGIRNAAINRLTISSEREDIGILWENFLVSERIKQLRYNKKTNGSFFWRTKQQQEIDYVEESEDCLLAVEFKWNTKRNAKIPKTFTNTYTADSAVITRANFREFVLMK
ncbi:MAG: ATP-binding protein [Bacteroidota bacterium]